MVYVQRCVYVAVRSHALSDGLAPLFALRRFHGVFKVVGNVGFLPVSSSSEKAL